MRRHWPEENDRKQVLVRKTMMLGKFYYGEGLRKNVLRKMIGYHVRDCVQHKRFSISHSKEEACLSNTISIHIHKIEIFGRVTGFVLRMKAKQCYQHGPLLTLVENDGIINCYRYTHTNIKLESQELK